MPKRGTKMKWPPEGDGAYPEFLATMSKESDRGCIIVGLSEIDQGLGEILAMMLSNGDSAADAEWLLDPLPGDRPLANLAIRTRLALCLGLIDKETRGVIDALRAIRNKHAHATADFKISANDVGPVLAAWKPGTRKFVLLIATKYFPDENAARIKLVGSLFAISCKLRNVADSIRAFSARDGSYQKLRRRIRKQPAWRRLTTRPKTD